MPPLFFYFTLPLHFLIFHSFLVDTVRVRMAQKERMREGENGRGKAGAERDGEEREIPRPFFVLSFVCSPNLFFPLMTDPLLPNFLFHQTQRRVGDQDASSFSHGELATHHSQILNDAPLPLSPSPLSLPHSLPPALSHF